MRLYIQKNGKKQTIDLHIKENEELNFAKLYEKVKAKYDWNSDNKINIKAESDFPYALVMILGVFASYIVYGKYDSIWLGFSILLNFLFFNFCIGMIAKERIRKFNDKKQHFMKSLENPPESISK